MGFDIERIASAVLDTEQWISNFSGRAYKQAFARYREQYEKPFLQALETTPADCLTYEFCRKIEDRWPQNTKKRRTAMDQTKMVITLYLNPMLLEMGENAAAFSSELCREWKARYDDAYHIATYDQICTGFRKNVLGFDLGCIFDEQEKFAFPWSKNK